MTEGLFGDHIQYCGQIASFNRISRYDFVRWNPTILEDCSGVWAEVNVCMGVPPGGLYKWNSGIGSDCTNMG